jgi:hypothetical protein
MSVFGKFSPKKREKIKKLLKSQTSNRPYLLLVSSGFFLGFKKKKKKKAKVATNHPSIHPSEHDEKGGYHPMKDLAKSGYKPYMKYKFLFVNHPSIFILGYRLKTKPFFFPHLSLMAIESLPKNHLIFCKF